MVTTSDWKSRTDQILNLAVANKMLHQTASNESFDGRLIYVNGKELINFGLCSYLGLEQDWRLKQGVIDAVTRYGTQFSTSRSYVSAPAYLELEEMLDRLFEGHTLVTPTTTLGHLAALPTLVEPEDAIILDLQVHNSVQTAAKQLQAQGVFVDVVPHNSIEKLEKKIQILSKEYRHIWYLADGVYSMYGDLAPIDELGSLLDRYEQLHLYLDDAHSMSWYGKNGRGYVLEHLPIHERMVVATSLNKAFSAAGGAIVFPNAQSRDRVKICGGPMVFSGPIQPPMLGAALASARIHLDDEIKQLQEELTERVQLCNHLLIEHQLPVVASSISPIFYIQFGSPSTMLIMVEKLFQEGFYVNSASFPAVALKNSGIRFTITRHLSFKDIQNLIEAIARNFREVLSTQQ
jgi:7-keto-8-aminopelargonate synthetase-like enzyme